MNNGYQDFTTKDEEQIKLNFNHHTNNSKWKTPITGDIPKLVLRCPSSLLSQLACSMSFWCEVDMLIPSWISGVSIDVSSSCVHSSVLSVDGPDGLGDSVQVPLLPILVVLSSEITRFHPPAIEITLCNHNIWIKCRMVYWLQVRTRCSIPWLWRCPSYQYIGLSISG